MSKEIQIKVKGEAKTIDSEVTGHGSLILAYDNANASFGIDYASEDQITLTLDAEAGFKIFNEGEVKIGGEYVHDIAGGSYEGKAYVEIVINKNASVKIDQTFTDEEQKTTAQITVKF